MFDAAEAIVTVDQRFHVRQFNRGATEPFGHAARDVIGQPLSVLLAERVRALREAQMRAFLIASEVSLQLGAREELCGVRRDGSEFPAEASMLKSAPNDPSVITVWLRNVTEQRRHEVAQAFLAGIGAALGSLLDYLQTLARAARTAMPILGETCVVDSYGADVGREVTIADTDDELEDIARVMREQYAPLYDSSGIPRAPSWPRPSGSVRHSSWSAFGIMERWTAQ